MRTYGIKINWEGPITVKKAIKKLPAEVSILNGMEMITDYIKFMEGT